MSSVIVSGDTSGSISITAPLVAGSGVLTLPTGTDTLVGKATTDTLTNKTLTSPTLTTPVIDSATFATVSGTAPIYGCRAWCRFNGTTAGTNAPTAGGNVSTVTRNGVGDYTVNFTTAMPDANYATTGNATSLTAGRTAVCSPYFGGTYTTSAVRFLVKDSADITIDSTIVNVTVFR